MDNQILVEYIKIQRAEGLNELCDRWHTFNSFREANLYLVQGSASAPKGGAYDKHDLIVMFSNGFEYKGRLDVTYDMKDCNVGQHIESWLSYVILNKNGTFSEQDIKEAKDMIRNYQLRDYDYNFDETKYKLEQEQKETQEKAKKQSSLSSLDIKEISKMVKKQLNDEYPNTKFSVSIQRYSMGRSLHISIMLSDIQIIRKFEDIPQEILKPYLDDGRTPDQLKRMQESNHHQVHVNSNDEYTPKYWCNGVFLTEQGFNLLKRITQISDQYNYDNSDPQSDYFHVNYYLHLNIGQYDKPYVQI